MTVSTPSKPTRLTRASLAQGLQHLAERDPDLAGIAARLGAPPLWARRPGFGTLVHIILEQQVSLASARAAYLKLLAVASPLTPERFLSLDDTTLKRAGFSRQKTTYGRELARAVGSGRLQLPALARLDDDAVRAALTAVKGIGPWTAEIYLLMALCRPDAWPTGDLALASAMQRVKRLPALPGPAEQQAIAANWHPWRAVAARLLWHDYLSDLAPRRRRSP